MNANTLTRVPTDDCEIERLIREVQASDPSMREWTPSDDDDLVREVNRARQSTNAKHAPGPWNDYPERDEAIANARLIAAAPDLLAACEAIESDLDMSRGPWDGFAHLVGVVNAIRETHLPKLRAAIAKAGGGE